MLGRYYVARGVKLHACGFVAMEAFTRGRIIRPHSSRSAESDLQEYIAVADAWCYRYAYSTI